MSGGRAGRREGGGGGGCETRRSRSLDDWRALQCFVPCLTYATLSFLPLLDELPARDRPCEPSPTCSLLALVDLPCSALPAGSYTLESSALRLREPEQRAASVRGRGRASGQKRSVRRSRTAQLRWLFRRSLSLSQSTRFEEELKMAGARDRTNSHGEGEVQKEEEARRRRALGAAPSTLRRSTPAQHRLRRTSTRCACHRSCSPTRGGSGRQSWPGRPSRGRPRRTSRSATWRRP